MIDEADRDGDGEVNLEDFNRCACSLECRGNLCLRLRPLRLLSLSLSRTQSEEAETRSIGQSAHSDASSVQMHSIADVCTDHSYLFCPVHGPGTCRLLLAIFCRVL